MAVFRKVKEQNFLELCADGTFEEIEEGIKAGNNIFAEDIGGFDALSNAARFNPDPRVVKMLLKHGASVNHRGNDGTTALIFAAEGSNAEIVNMLLEAGSDVNAARDDGITALMGAAKKNTPEIVTILLKAGANVNVRDTNGMTPLLYAAMNNSDPKIIDILIEAGADDVASKNGETALILAARWNNPGVVDALIKAGANIKAFDKDGKPAIFYALENKKLDGSEVLNLLRGVESE